MSWSVTMMGKAERIAEELPKYTETLTGQSKSEYEEALPHLIGLVSQNVSPEMLINLNASGHATFTEGKKTYGSCIVKLEQFYGKLLL